MIKILVLGAPGTGKTSIVRRYLTDSFSTEMKPTIVSDLHLSGLQLNSKEYFLNLWDVGCSDSSSTFSKLFCRGAHGAVIVVDALDNRSFEVAKLWKKHLANQTNLADGAPLPVYLLINKYDLILTRRRDISLNANREDYLEDFCNESFFQGWYYVSAKTGLNVKSAIKDLMVHIFNHDLSQYSEESQQIKRTVLSYRGRDKAFPIESLPPTKKSTCC